MHSAGRFAVRLVRTAGSTVAWTLRTYGREASEVALTRIAYSPFAGTVTENMMKVNSIFCGRCATTGRRSTSTPSTTPGQKPGRTGA